MRHPEINARVISLDMENLTPEDIKWLHELATLVLHRKIQEFYRAQGINEELC